MLYMQKYACFYIAVMLCSAAFAQKSRQATLYFRQDAVLPGLYEGQYTGRSAASGMGYRITGTDAAFVIEPRFGVVHFRYHHKIEDGLRLEQQHAGLELGLPLSVKLWLGIRILAALNMGWLPYQEVRVRQRVGNSFSYFSDDALHAGYQTNKIYANAGLGLGFQFAKAPKCMLSVMVRQQANGPVKSLYEWENSWIPKVRIEPNWKPLLPGIELSYAIK
jgi:hypothetical protein